MNPARFLRMLVTPFNVIALLVLVGVLVARDTLISPGGSGLDPSLLEDDTPEQAQLAARLHYATADMTAFVVETRTVRVQYDSPTARASATLAAWLAGPERAGSILPAPRDLSKPVVVVRREGAFVDFGRDWTGMRTGAESEWRILCGITLTLADNAEAQQVQFLVGGEPRDTLAGHVAIRAPFTPATCGRTDAAR